MFKRKRKVINDLQNKREINKSKNTWTKEQKKSMRQFNKGEWVDTDIVCGALGIDFSTGYDRFELSRMASWWSMCGKTPEERMRNGQRIETKFRKKRGDK